MNAIITGATKGIGRAIAIELAMQGYNIIACARDVKALAELKIDIEKFGVTVLAIATDCSIKNEVYSFVEQALAFAPEIDVLVNNVGVFIPSSLLDEDDEVFELQQKVNINAAYFISKKVGQIMRRQQKGHIFNICSVASKEPIENAGSYCVTKASLLSLNNVLRTELAPHQVKVTAIVPGSTYTASWEGTTLDKAKFVQPEDVAKTINAILQLSAAANIDEVVIKPLNF